MKKLITKSFVSIIAIVMILGVAFAFSGCEETQQTLEDIAASNGDMIKTITDSLETPEGTTVAVEFSGDSFDVTYKFDDVLDEDLEEPMISAFDRNEDVIKESCETAIENLETQTGITGIVGTLRIENANGTELWSRSYPEQ